MFSALFAVTMILMQAAPSASPVSPAPASSTVSPVTVKPEVAISKRPEVDPREVVCHDEIPIGSRFPKKVCATNAAFSERAREDQQTVREWQAGPITTSKQ